LSLELCRALCGSDLVSSRLAAGAIAQAGKKFGDETVARLVTTFGDSHLGGIQADRELLGIARAITYFLYTGLLPEANGSDLDPKADKKPEIQLPDDYFEAVLWRVILAHPPGLSGGYFGHWHYPPEDLDA
jgi:hypothetical protein